MSFNGVQKETKIWVFSDIKKRQNGHHLKLLWHRCQDEASLLMKHEIGIHGIGH